MIKVGITGGIGSGKSMICRIFTALGYPVFYADVEARLAIESDQFLRKQLMDAFGPDIYSDFGLNKEKMAQLVFSSEKTREKVNSLVHPAVRRRFMEWTANQDDSDLVFYEAAILFESGVYKAMNYCVTVFAPEQTRITRVKKRDGHSEARIQKIIETQLAEEEKLRRADFVIHNHGDQLIIPQILEILPQIKPLG